jgi:glycolate oxidase iron-sulfur subunit
VVYPGCLVELGYPELLADVKAVYGRLGWRVVVPPGLVCCGLPAAHAGDLETARRLAAINLRAVLPHLHGRERGRAGPQEDARLGFLCPSCAVAFKQDYPEYLFGKLSGGAGALGASGVSKADLQLAASRAEDAAALAWRLGIAEHLKGETVPSVTYHDPCHLRRLLGVVKEPRAALRAVSGRGYREAPNPDSCCGFGGTFAVEHPEAGSALLARRVEGLVSTGAELVATACPGCMAWLANGLDRAGSAQRPVHLIELLARGLR